MFYLTKLLASSLSVAPTVLAMRYLRLRFSAKRAPASVRAD